MSDPQSPSLLIRCPSCGQRFKVGENFLNRTVECGGCDHRFRIDDEVIVRAKKSYPGDRQSQGLNQFQRVAMPNEQHAKPKGLMPMIYGKAPDPAVIEPTSPLRILTGIAGVAAVFIAALFLMFGTGAGMALDGMPMVNRLVIAGFTSFLALIALLYANPKARLKALIVGLGLGGGLLSLPFFFSADTTKSANTSGVLPISSLQKTNHDAEEKNDSLKQLKERIGTKPLEEEIQKMTVAGHGKTAMGVWLKDLNYEQRFLVRDYMFRVTKAHPTASHIYPRDRNNHLLVLSEMTMSLAELAEVASALGTVENTYPELSVVEVKINNTIFTERPLEKLTNSKDVEFYSLNMMELENISLDRAKSAVQRLGGAEPKIFRADVTKKLIALLNSDAVNFKADVCNALAVWSEQPGEASQAALVEVKKLIAQNKSVPPAMVALLVKEKNQEAIPSLDQLWLMSPETWETSYGDFGKGIEAAMLHLFPETKGSQCHSAVRILGRVGGSDSLPKLIAAEAEANRELKIVIDQAKKSIQERLSRQQ
jgi:hypothetical protein